jgi:hypothetical protein
MVLKTVNLILISMIASSNLITLCPENNGRSAEIHLVLDSCDAHECHWNQNTHRCDSEVCEHNFCNDKPLLDAFQIPQPDKSFSTVFKAQVAFLSTFLPELYITEKLTTTNSQHQFSSFFPLTTVLRI